MDVAETAKRGRKLDTSRNEKILEAALTVLADVGYEGMTIDMVASLAGSARATLYRRWATKADLVVEAIDHMSQSDADHGSLPDTGTLRGDLIASIVPQTIEEQQLRIRVMSGVVTLVRTDPRLARLTGGAGLTPWVELSRSLLQRAVDRGEFPEADIATLSTVIPMMCVCRAAVEQLPITREFSITLIDSVILPAMRGTSLP